jgi:hypothetical protein
MGRGGYGEMKGSRVKIISTAKYASGLIGREGIIENTSCGHTIFGVRIEGCTNVKSQYGLFWFQEDEIEFIESEECIMLNQNENFIVAGVKFLEGTNRDKEYYYAMFETYDVGDLVVVQTGHHGLSIAEIASVDCTDKNKVQCSREIVCKVDMSKFDARQERRASLRKLKKDMDERIKKLQETAIYEMLAKEDKSLAEMLSEYKKLEGNC